MADKRLLFYKHVQALTAPTARAAASSSAPRATPQEHRADGTFVGAEALGEVGGLGPGPAEARERTPAAARSSRSSRT